MNIGEVSGITNLSISTLRYYDKQGLLPNVKRDSSGIRKFENKDLNSLRLINCLKMSGMQIKDIKTFINWCSMGDETLEKRLNMFKNQELEIKKQIDELNKALELVKFKKWYYTTAVNDKTEKYVKEMDINDMPKEIQMLYKNTH